MPPTVPLEGFARVRARSLWLVLLALVALEGARMAAARATGVEMVELFGAAFYPLLAAWALWQLRRAGVPLRQLAGGRPTRRDLGTATVLAAALLGLSGALFWLQLYPVSLLAPGWVSEVVLNGDEASTLVPGAPLRSAAMVIEVVLLGPAVEELVTRGVLLHRWAYRWGVARGVLASSLFFALLHFDPLGAFAFGVAMSLLYLSTGSLLVPIACHALYNGLIVAIEAGDLVWGEPGTYTLAELHQDGWMAALALAVTAPVLWRWARGRWPRPPLVAPPAA